MPSHHIFLQQLIPNFNLLVHKYDFEQIIDDRYNKKALILASQLPVADWYNVFQSELIAEACLDRLVHKAIKFDLKGESLRKSINFADDTEDY